MGKTSKPLTLLVTDQTLYDTPEVQTLIAKGHIAHPPGDVLALYDAIIGPRCWRILPTLGSLESSLEVMVKGIRGARKVKEDLI